MTEKSLAVDAWESLFRAQVSVLRRLTAEFPTHEISFTEYDVLFNLSRAEGRCLRIRDHSHLTSHSRASWAGRVVAVLR